LRRRQLLELAASCTGGSAALASGVTASLTLVGCPSAAPPSAERLPGWTPSLFNREQALSVEDVAEVIIPEGVTPGAKSAGVARFIESVVRDVHDDAEQKAFLAGLDQVGAAARAAHGKAFAACTKGEQDALFTSFVKEQTGPAPGPHQAFVRSFRELCIRGFCNSKLGATRVLQYEPTPGEFQGCVPLASVGKAWAL
jgi:gluconate 2-dehydrogenase gamma chain